MESTLRLGPLVLPLAPLLRVLAWIVGSMLHERLARRAGRARRPAHRRGAGGDPGHHQATGQQCGRHHPRGAGPGRGARCAA